VYRIVSGAIVDLRRCQPQLGAWKADDRAAPSQSEGCERLAMSVKFGGQVRQYRGTDYGSSNRTELLARGHHMGERDMRRPTIKRLCYSLCVFWLDLANTIGSLVSPKISAFGMAIFRPIVFYGVRIALVAKNSCKMPRSLPLQL
jgi:hypothetical protein